jgi:membrane-associated phospholipid phosphatase
MADSSGLSGEPWVVHTLHRVSERTPGLHETAVGFASVGIAVTGVFVVVAALVLGVRRGRVVGALAAIAAAVAAYGIAHLLKRTVHRVPPELGSPSRHSFPEGPGAFTSALAVALVPLVPRLAVFAAVMTVLDGVSQVARGYHWPSDVLAAWAIGASCALVARVATAGRRG